MRKRARSILVLALLIPLVISACRRPTVDLPDRTVPVSEAAAQRFEQKIRDLRSGGNGEYKVAFTEEELTSYLNVKVEQQSLPIRQPTVWFSRGKVYVRGDFQAEGFPVKGNAIFVIAMAIQDGVLTMRVEQAVIGPVPVPQSLLDRLSSLANERSSALLGPIRIKQLQILEREAIIVLTP